MVGSAGKFFGLKASALDKDLKECGFCATRSAVIVFLSASLKDYLPTM